MYSNVGFLRKWYSFSQLWFIPVGGISFDTHSKVTIEILFFRLLKSLLFDLNKTLILKHTACMTLFCITVYIFQNVLLTFSSRTKCPIVFLVNDKFVLWSNISGTALYIPVCYTPKSIYIWAVGRARTWKSKIDEFEHFKRKFGEFEPESEHKFKQKRKYILCLYNIKYSKTPIQHDSIQHETP